MKPKKQLTKEMIPPKFLFCLERVGRTEEFLDKANKNDWAKQKDYVEKLYCKYIGQCYYWLHTRSEIRQMFVEWYENLKK